MDYDYDVTHSYETWAMDKVFSDDYDVTHSSRSLCHNVIDMYFPTLHEIIFPIWQTMCKKTDDNYIRVIFLTLYTGYINYC